MPALFIFLFKVNVALLIFCLGYYVVLRRLTFYTLNRAYLAIAIIFSSVYPLIDLSGFAQRHQQLTMPVQTVIMSWKAPAESFVNPIMHQPNYWHWAELLFWTGAVLFALRLLIQLLSLYKLYKNSKPGKIQEHDVRIVNTNISPFSFWQSIYINPENLAAADLKSILQHEHIHIKEWHTLDILLTEISVIFYWFNPGVWLMKKAVRENIEFITDRKILQKGIDSRTYQYSLLNVSFSATTPTGITNHFNFSTLKKRIQMMNAKRSSNVNLTRYAFLVPAVLICLFAFSLSKAELVKKSSGFYKTIAASVSNLNLVTAVKNNANPTVKKTLHPVKALDTVKKTGTITATTLTNGADTNKSVILTVTKTDKLDSLTFYINGGKSTKRDVNNISPGDFESMSMAKDANGIIRNVMVQTKNSYTTTIAKSNEAGKSPTYTVTTKSTDTTGRQSAAKVTVSNVLLVSGVALHNNNNKMNSVIVTAKNNESIDNFSGKLIFIDGKEASKDDLKKLPVSDINSINIKTGKEVTDIYGEKAQKGVIYITTKKGK